MRRWLSSNNILPNTKTLSTSATGIVLFLTGLALLTAMDAVVKLLVEDTVHVIQLLFVRTCIICALLSLFYVSRGKIKQLKPVRYKAQIARGLIGFLAPFGFFLSLKYLSLTEASVVFFSNIFMITLASALFLREQVGPWRWSAVVIGYIGVIIAINPRGDGELFGYLLVLVSAATYAFLFISGKKLGSTESSAALVLFYNLGVGAIALVWLPNTWSWLSINDYLGILLLSCLAVVGQYCMTQGFAFAEASLLAPLNYTALVVTLAFDWVLWQAVPEAQTITGALIIIGSSAFVLYRQHRLKATTPPHS